MPFAAFNGREWTAPWPTSKTIEAISTADPAKREYRESIGESLAWLSDARDAEGQFDQAIAARQSEIAALDHLFAETRDNNYRQKLIHANRRLGILYAEQGRVDLALQQLRTAVALSDQLLPIEPTNTRWLESAFNAHLDLAKYLLLTGSKSEASEQIQTGCGMVATLVRRHSALLPGWRWRSVRCSILQARLALSNSDKAGAIRLAQQAIASARSIRTGDAATDAITLATYYRSAGDIMQKAGDAAAQSTAAQNLQQYGRALGDFLGRANSQLSRTTLSQLITAHTSDLVKEADQYVSGTYAAAYITQRAAFARSGVLSAFVAAGIASQFPDRFPDTAFAPAQIGSQIRPGLQLIGLMLLVVAAIEIALVPALMPRPKRSRGRQSRR